MRINPRFRSIIPPLTTDEYQQLEQNLLTDGCRDALVTWNDTIVDGHNRYEICQKHGIAFAVANRHFIDENEALLWIIDNQRGRRNLSDGWKWELVQEKRRLLLGAGLEKRKENLKQGPALGQQAETGPERSLSDSSEGHSTKKELAAELNWAIGKVAQAGYVWAHGDEEIKQRLKDNAETIHSAYRKTRKALGENARKARKRVQLDALAQAAPGGICLRHGDFRELIKDVANDSIDLILTDPPYPKVYLPLWSALAQEAARVLKPGGFLIAYSGQNHLLPVLNSLAQHLEYYWLGMLYHKGVAAQRFEVNMFNRAKPILFFYKSPRVKQETWLEDVLESPQKDKAHHAWGQNTAPLRKLVECFSLPGQTVLEPFAGGGPVILACIETKRAVIAYENDKDVYDKLVERFGHDQEAL